MYFYIKKICLQPPRLCGYFDTFVCQDEKLKNGTTKCQPSVSVSNILLFSFLISHQSNLKYVSFLVCCVQLDQDARKLQVHNDTSEQVNVT